MQALVISMGVSNSAIYVFELIPLSKPKQFYLTMGVGADHPRRRFVRIPLIN
jgi:hypothetical protein